jgi:pimeloyl-ACP methyl ester carboxylesterase
LGVKDLEKVIVDVLHHRLGRERDSSLSFHLYGHSFGGVLAYELLQSYLSAKNATTTTTNPRLHLESIILSNVPTDLQKCNDEYDTLHAKDPQKFWQQYACRVGIPPALQSSINNVGQVWSGMDVVKDYKAVKLLLPSTTGDRKSRITLLPSLLVISCRNDFAYSTSKKEIWGSLLQSYPEKTKVEYVALENCHYPFYEDATRYGEVITEFLDKVEQ